MFINFLVYLMVKLAILNALKSQIILSLQIHTEATFHKMLQNSFQNVKRNWMKNVCIERTIVRQKKPTYTSNIDTISFNVAIYTASHTCLSERGNFF